MSFKYGVALSLVLSLALADASAAPLQRRAHFDPEAGPNEYTLQFPSELPLPSSQVSLPITGGTFVLETDAELGASRLVEWRQDIAPLVLFGASTGPITITIDTESPSTGTFDPVTRVFSVTGRFRIEFDDSQLAQFGFASPFIIDGTETGVIDGLGKIGTISMSLEGSGLFAGGSFTYTCSTTARIEYDLFADEAQTADVNHDRSVDIADALSILDMLFLGESASCPTAAAVNGDDRIDLSDAVYLLQYLFYGGPPPSEEAVSCSGAAM